MNLQMVPAYTLIPDVSPLSSDSWYGRIKDDVNDDDTLVHFSEKWVTAEWSSNSELQCGAINSPRWAACPMPAPLRGLEMTLKWSF